MTADNVSARDARAANIAVLTATVIIAHQVAGKATRDGLFLSYFDVTELPRVVVISALLSMLGVLAMSRLLAGLGPSRLVPGVFALSALMFVGEWLLFNVMPNATAAILYLHMSIFGALLISGFWSVLNERFDPHSAKRTIARVAAAATLGGVLGGVLAERTTDLLGIRAMLVVLGLLHAGCAIGVWLVASGGGPRPGAGEELDVRSGFKVLAASGYLRSMGLLMVLVAATAALLDYVFKSEAAAAIGKGEDLVAFFASFYAVVGLLTFAIQSLVGARMLRRFGIAGTMLVLPVSVLIGGAVAVLVPRLASVVLLRGAEGVFANSFFRAGFELLYTPVTPADKRPTKAIIDVASNRLGDLAGGGALIALLAVIAAPPAWLVLSLALVCALMALLVVWRLHAGYVGQLAANLASGVVSMRAGEAQDATTQRILAELSPDAERRMLEQRLAEQRAGTAIDPAAGNANPLVPLVADLTSGDRERIRAALRSPHFDRSLTAHVVAVLDDPAIADEARLELRWLVPRIIGQLTDALLDPDTPPGVRQRLPSVMEVHHSPRTVQALTDGLDDPVFLVRYACARALKRMLNRSHTLSVPAERVFDIVLRETDISDAAWRSRQKLREEAVALSEGEPEHDLSLEHVFCLLALVLDADAINLALQAVVSRDRALRGTALEYLENVLPAPLRQSLWDRLGVREPRAGRRRTRHELEQELRSRQGA